MIDNARMGPGARHVMAPNDPRDQPQPGDIIRSPLAYGRETIESIVVAFALALLFRAFEAEAFVIPTGSMAPTLMGRHKDLSGSSACGSCGRDFRVGCSAEEDDQSQGLRTELSRLEAEQTALNRVLANDSIPSQDRERARRRMASIDGDRGAIAQLRMRLSAKLVPAAKCPGCANVIPLVIPLNQQDNTDVAQATANAGQMRYDPAYPSFNGDRILVSKFAYDFAEPKRWDVVVFKYPEDAKTNYIKRLIGLPNETVSIAGGDIWTTRAGGTATIARKPPEKILAMLQCVHDSRYESSELQKAGWPTCWSDWSSPNRKAECRWTTTDQGRSFAVACQEGGTATLRYRHFFPTATDWKEIAAGESTGEKATPILVDDFQSYNAIATRSHWVGDLAVECELENLKTDGKVALDLVESGKAHRCTIDLATGDVELTIADGMPSDAPKARTRVRGKGSWKILFANVDDELTLFVDGRKVYFDRATLWARSIEEAERSQPYDGLIEPGMNQSGDLSPAGVTALAAEVRVSRLRILRDVFYISAHDIGARAGEFIERPRLEFPLEADQFFVLGDNSAASKDSRLWVEGHHIDRTLLIGKALAVFWPHAVPARWNMPLKIGGTEVRLPSWPNFARMRFVR